MSRDFNCEKVIIPLPAKFHLQRTASILEDVGRQISHDPEMGAWIVSAPKFMGLQELTVSSNSISEMNAMMVFEIKTKPGKIDAITNEFRKLAKLAFEEMDRLLIS